MQSTDQGTLETWVFHMRLSLEWKLVSMYAPTWHAPHTHFLSPQLLLCYACVKVEKRFFLNTLLILFSGLSLFKSLIQEEGFMNAESVCLVIVTLDFTPEDQRSRLENF